MNKEEIIKKLKQSNLDKERIIVISGASLVIQGIIATTNDIDISCDIDYYNQLDWNTKKGAFDIEIKYKEIYEISYNLYYPDDFIIIEDYKFMTLEKCLEIKKRLNRPKDQEIIKKISLSIKK